MFTYVPHDKINLFASYNLVCVVCVELIDWNECFITYVSLSFNMAKTVPHIDAEVVFLRSLSKITYTCANNTFTKLKGSF